MINKKDLLRLLKTEGYLKLSDSDGSCACGALSIGGIHVRTHCHRTGHCCKYSGVHIWSDQELWIPREDLQEIGEYLANKMGKDYWSEFSVKVTTQEKEKKLGY